MSGWNERWFGWKGGRLHYREAGTGTPLLLLHGGAADSGWRSWEEAPKFLPGLCLLAPDFPGFGDSGLQTDRVDVPFLLDSVKALTDELGLGYFNLVGFSTGGLIAAHLALQSPERIGKLALVAAAELAPGIPFRPFSNLVAAYPQIHRVLYWGAGLNLWLMRRGLRRLVHDPSKLPESFLIQTRQMLRRPGAGAAWRKFLQAELIGDHFRNQVAGLLPEISVPTILLHGRHDQLVAVDHSILAARQIRGSEIRIFERCGHWIHREDPAAFYSALSNFM